MCVNPLKNPLSGIGMAKLSADKNPLGALGMAKAVLGKKRKGGSLPMSAAPLGGTVLR